MEDPFSLVALESFSRLKIDFGKILIRYWLDLFLVWLSWSCHLKWFWVFSRWHWGCFGSNNWNVFLYFTTNSWSIAVFYLIFSRFFKFFKVLFLSYLSCFLLSLVSLQVILMFPGFSGFIRSYVRRFTFIIFQS